MGDAGVYLHHTLSAQHDLHSRLGRREHIFHTDLQKTARVKRSDLLALRQCYITTCNGNYSPPYLVCVILACILIILEVLSVIYIVDLFAMNTYFTPPINQAWLYHPRVFSWIIKLENVSNGYLRPPGWQYQLFVSLIL